MKPPYLEIIYQDEALLALNKPSAMHCERRRQGSEQTTIASWLAAHFPETAQEALRWEDAGLVQRLDYETSGVLLCALCNDVASLLREDFTANACEKRYLALVEGSVPESYFGDGAIGSRYRRSKKATVYDDASRAENARALPAHTDFRRLASSQRVSLIEARSSTGRRHQIRAHSAFAGYPLVGDELYGASSLLSELQADSAGSENLLPQFLLHASSLQINHPVSGERLLLQASMAEPIQRFLASLDCSAPV